MNQKTVYLAGLISTDFPESLVWRTDCTPKLKDAGFHVLSPMRGKSAFKLEHGGLTDPTLTAKDIILRDFADVNQADVILMHLEDFGSPRPLLGTICELAWSWMLKKPIVAIAKSDNKLMRLHPFVVDSVAHYSESVAEGVDFTIHHYGPIV